MRAARFPYVWMRVIYQWHSRPSSGASRSQHSHSTVDRACHRIFRHRPGSALALPHTNSPAHQLSHSVTLSHLLTFTHPPTLTLSLSLTPTHPLIHPPANYLTLSPPKKQNGKEKGKVAKTCGALGAPSPPKRVKVELYYSSPQTTPIGRWENRRKVGKGRHTSPGRCGSRRRRSQGPGRHPGGRHRRCSARARMGSACRR